MQEYLAYLDIFLGILGVGIAILFCTSFCRVCQRYREEQVERAALRHSGQDRRTSSIYVIPFPTRQDSDDTLSESQYSQEIYSLPRYNTDYYGPPPTYNELGCKPEDLPPAYTEYSNDACPIPAPPHTDTVGAEIQAQ